MFRFLIGSSLLFVGMMIGLSGAITLIGLPLGLAVAAAGLDLLVGTKRSSAREAG